MSYSSNIQTDIHMTLALAVGESQANLQQEGRDGRKANHVVVVVVVAA